MSDPTERARNYTRGYACAIRKAWPAHKPPTPPDAIIGPIFDAARAMRDEADAVLSGFEEADPIFKRLSDAIDVFDERVKNLTKYITTP
jgi:hypothetical protein